MADGTSHEDSAEPIDAIVGHERLVEVTLTTYGSGQRRLYVLVGRGGRRKVRGWYRWVGEAMPADMLELSSAELQGEYRELMLTMYGIQGLLEGNTGDLPLP